MDHKQIAAVRRDRSATLPTALPAPALSPSSPVSAYQKAQSLYRDLRDRDLGAGVLGARRGSSSSNSIAGMGQQRDGGIGQSPSPSSGHSFIPQLWPRSASSHSHQHSATLASSRSNDSLSHGHLRGVTGSSIPTSVSTSVIQGHGKDRDWSEVWGAAAGEEQRSRSFGTLGGPLRLGNLGSEKGEGGFVASLGLAPLVDDSGHSLPLFPTASDQRHPFPYYQAPQYTSDYPQLLPLAPLSPLVPPPRTAGRITQTRSSDQVKSAGGRHHLSGSSGDSPTVPPTVLGYAGGVRNRRTRQVERSASSPNLKGSVDLSISPPPPRVLSASTSRIPQPKQSNSSRPPRPYYHPPPSSPTLVVPLGLCEVITFPKPRLSPILISRPESPGLVGYGATDQPIPICGLPNLKRLSKELPPLPLDALEAEQLEDDASARRVLERNEESRREREEWEKETLSSRGARASERVRSDSRSRASKRALEWEEQRSRDIETVERMAETSLSITREEARRARGHDRSGSSSAPGSLSPVRGEYLSLPVLGPLTPPMDWRSGTPTSERSEARNGIPGARGVENREVGVVEMRRERVQSEASRSSGRGEKVGTSSPSRSGSRRPSLGPTSPTEFIATALNPPQETLYRLPPPPPERHASSKHASATIMSLFQPPPRPAPSTSTAAPPRPPSPVSPSKIPILQRPPPRVSSAESFTKSRALTSSFQIQSSLPAPPRPIRPPTRTPTEFLLDEEMSKESQSRKKKTGPEPIAIMPVAEGAHDPTSTPTLGSFQREGAPSPPEKDVVGEGSSEVIEVERYRELSPVVRMGTEEEGELRAQMAEAHASLSRDITIATPSRLSGRGVEESSRRQFVSSPSSPMSDGGCSNISGTSGERSMLNLDEEASSFKNLFFNPPPTRLQAAQYREEFNEGHRTSFSIASRSFVATPTEEPVDRRETPSPYSYHATSPDPSPIPYKRRESISTVAPTSPSLAAVFESTPVLQPLQLLPETAHLECVSVAEYATSVVSESYATATEGASSIHLVERDDALDSSRREGQGVEENTDGALEDLRIEGPGAEGEEEIVAVDQSKADSEPSSPESFIDFGGKDSALPSPTAEGMDRVLDTPHLGGDLSFLDVENIPEENDATVVLDPSPPLAQTSSIEVAVDDSAHAGPETTSTPAPVSHEKLVCASTIPVVVDAPSTPSSPPPSPTPEPATSRVTSSIYPPPESFLTVEPLDSQSGSNVIPRNSVLSVASSAQSSTGSALDNMLTDFPVPPVPDTADDGADNMEVSNVEEMVSEEETSARGGEDDVVAVQESELGGESSSESKVEQDTLAQQRQSFYEGNLGDAEEELDYGSDEDVTLTSVPSVATLRRSISVVDVRRASLVQLRSSTSSLGGSLTENTSSWTIASTSTDTITGVQPRRRLSRSSEEVNRLEPSSDDEFDLTLCENHLDMVRRALNRQSDRFSRATFAESLEAVSPDDTSRTQPLPFPSPASFTLPMARTAYTPPGRSNSGDLIGEQEASGEPARRWTGAGISSLFLRGSRKNSVAFTSTREGEAEGGEQSGTGTGGSGSGTGRSRASSGASRVLHERIPSDPAVLNPLRRGWETPEERTR